MKGAPLPVWITQGILLLASVVFTVLMAVAFATEEISSAHIMYPVLLVVFPVVGFTGLLTGARWGRRAATLALLCVWAFEVRFFGSTRYFSAAFVIGPYFSAFFLMLTTFAAGVPLLLLRLYRGEAESRFFAR
jgi:hypothetical protein